MKAKISLCTLVLNLVFWFTIMQQSDSIFKNLFRSTTMQYTMVYQVQKACFGKL